MAVLIYDDTLFNKISSSTAFPPGSDEFTRLFWSYNLLRGIRFNEAVD
jgi:hypothetical protein